MSAAAPAAGAGASPPPFHYWEESDHFLYKVWVVVREIFIVVAAISLFLYNPPLFAPLFFLGMVLHDPLDTAFGYIHKVFMLQPVIASIILLLGMILAFPASAWVACGLVALWCGKRLVDLTFS